MYEREYNIYLQLTLIHMSNNKQIHKKLSTEQVITILENYLSKAIDLNTALEYLGIQKSRFYELLKSYKQDPNSFSIEYKRRKPTRKIPPYAEELIIKLLKKEKQIIENKNNPVRTYNYSYIKDVLKEDYNIDVSVPTIIDRAKKYGYYHKTKIKQIHDREVLTNMIGELIQHDASHHMWLPSLNKRICLITSLDDYSRQILYADFVEKETTFAHITAIKSVFLQYGLPLKYYVDQHSVFRYVKNRDKQSIWCNYTKFTDDVDTQWKKIMNKLNVEVIYALSPQAKGKIERPYRWLQDRIVRMVYRYNIKSLYKLREMLRKLVYKYNNEWIHSTTKQIPVIRYETAYGEGLNLFRPFKLPSPYTHLDDLFCLTIQRRVNNYRKISLNGIEISVPNGNIREIVELKIVPNPQRNTLKIRFWQNNIFLGSQELPKKLFNSIFQF